MEMNLEKMIASSVNSAVEKALCSGVSQIKDIIEKGANSSRKYMPDSLLTEKEVSELLNIDKTTLQQWRYFKKHIPYIKIGGAVRYKYQDVIDMSLKYAIKVTE